MARSDLSKRPTKEDAIAAHMEAIMEELGCDMKDASLRDTPMRVAKMFVNEVFSGMDPKNEPNLTVFPNDYQYDQIVSLCDIKVYSMCEHHFLPFPMRVHIGYIPGKKVVGLSKLARVAKYFSQRPQVQERLTKQIADYLVAKLSPQGVIVVIEGQHMCMSMRGVENDSATMVTSDRRGVFAKQLDMEQKFLELIKTSRGTWR